MIHLQRERLAEKIYLRIIEEGQKITQLEAKFYRGLVTVGHRDGLQVQSITQWSFFLGGEGVVLPAYTRTGCQ